jgi:hypothetical protein
MRFIAIYKTYPERLAFESLLTSVSMKDNLKSFMFYDELYIKHKVKVDEFLSAHYKNMTENKKKKYNTISFQDVIYIFRNICLYYSIPFSSKRKYFNNTYKVYYFVKLN